VLHSTSLIKFYKHLKAFVLKALMCLRHLAP